MAEKKPFKSKLKTTRNKHNQQISVFDDQNISESIYSVLQTKFPSLSAKSSYVESFAIRLTHSLRSSGEGGVS